MNRKDVMHLIIVVALLGVGLVAHLCYQKDANPTELLIEEVAEVALEMEGVPVDFVSKDIKRANRLELEKEAVKDDQTAKTNKDGANTLE